MTGIVEVERLTKDYGTARRGATLTRAVDDVSFSVSAGQCFGVVGESGSGKTTLAKMLLGLVRPTSGAIRIDGIDRQTTSRAHRSTLHRTIQVVFQDPYSSLNPARTIGATLVEALEAAGRRGGSRARDVAALLDLVGLREEHARRKPVALSGGERQRVAIARALAMKPRLIVCDEVVSALDVSVQAQILNLLQDVREGTGTSLLFISHDLGVARQVVDRAYVLHRGRFVEDPLDLSLLDAPEHPYTRELVASVPRSAGAESRGGLPPS